MFNKSVYPTRQVSTPSGDNAERNPLSGSCESIDTAGRREQYIKSAFDSLSGADLDATLTAGNYTDHFKLDIEIYLLIKSCKH